MASPLFSTLSYWLVNHPKIAHFTWTEGETLASSVSFAAVSVAGYLSATFLLRSAVEILPSLGPRILKPITAVHSLVLCLLSLIMAVGCTLSIISHAPDAAACAKHAICFPLELKPTGPLFFWAHVFYLSKILEFGDTLLIILGRSIQRLSFLHVYHHATVVVMCYLWLRTRQSMFPVALVTNATVHVIMYGYYFLCAIGSRPKWKRLVTNCQIVQFVLSFVLSGWMLYEHSVGSGCSGFLGWCFNAAFNASLLALFLNFHSKNYARTRQVRSEPKGSGFSAEKRD
ncbi:PREDICTED: elongation of fatty acids protein 3-like [Tarenaya hassleriana]|uniref:elongation of fatty acids protein 3-like n=1 Tax=Tarenaya hassleriana TaxID=28532 RepID=UPI00053C8286|nr:PREDICTED: elongation of fatty acids protein 3-like [Tarenaya hassleriana]